MVLRPRAAAVAILLLAAGCSSAQPTASATATTSSMVMGTAPSPGAVATSRRLLAPADFAVALSTPGTVSIDVHVPFQGKIAGTDLVIPYDEIAQQSNQLPSDHTTALAIYCRTGVMSAVAAKTLSGLGYSDVIELRGGMQAWQASGRTLLATP